MPEELDLGWLFISIDKTEPGQGRAVAQRALDFLDERGGDASHPRFVIVLGHEADLDDIDDALFHWCANASHDRDLLFSADRSRIAFDATPKQPGDGHAGCPVREWPPIIRMSDEMIERVTKRWPEYGL